MVKSTNFRLEIPVLLETPQESSPYTMTATTHNSVLQWFISALSQKPKASEYIRFDHWCTLHLP